MPDNLDIVVRRERPSISSSDLLVVAIVTTMGALYVVPDVLPEHLQEFIRQIDWARQGQEDANLVLRNLSQVTLTIPFRIVGKIGQLVDGDISRFQEIWSG